MERTFEFDVRVPVIIIQNVCSPFLIFFVYFESKDLIP